MDNKERAFSNLLLLVGSVFLMGMVIVVLAQIYYRFVLLKPLSWSDELSRGLFIWSVVIGAAIAMGEKAHTSLTVFTDKFSPKWRLFAFGITNLLIVIFCLVVSIYGFKLTVVAHMNTSAALKLPMSYFYASVPIASGIMALYATRDLLRIWFSKETSGDN